MFNNNCSLLEYGMLISNFFDAIREGDGKCIFRCWKIQLPYLGNDVPKHSYKLIWNRTSLLRSGLENNILPDLLLEFFNRLLKEVQHKLGHNATNHKVIYYYFHAVEFTKVALDNLNRECCVIRHSGQHYEISVASNLQKIAVEIISHEAITWTPGSSYEQFKEKD